MISLSNNQRLDTLNLESSIEDSDSNWRLKLRKRLKLKYLDCT